MNGEIHVLYVDDDHTSLLIRGDSLGTYDRLNVITAASVAAGHQRLSEDRIDCILSDFNMDTQNGVEFLRAVRKQRPHIPFILFSNRLSDEIVAEALTAGATDCVSKSACRRSYDLLVNRIENAVEYYRIQRHMR